MPSRTRTKGSPLGDLSVVEQTTYYGGTVSTSPPGVFWPLHVTGIVETNPAQANLPGFSYESMTDNIGPGRPFREVVHVKRKQNDTIYVSDYAVYNAAAFGPEGVVFYRSASFATNRLGSLLWSAMPSPWVNLRSDTNSEAISNLGLTEPENKQLKLLPAAKSRIARLAVANSLYELKDMPSLIKYARTWLSISKFRDAKSMNRIGELLQRRWALKGQSAKELISVLREEFGEHWLQYKFAIAPTVADVMSITSEVMGRGSPFKEVFDVTRTGHVSRTRALSFDLGPTAPFTRVEGSERAEISRIDGLRVDLSERYSRYNTETFRNMQKFLDRYLGNPYAAIWEAVPFSFMADWMLSVDNVIDALWYGNQSDIKLMYWSSTKHEYSRDYQLSYACDFNNYAYVSPYDAGIAVVWNSVGPLKDEFSSYSRKLEDSPNPFDYVRTRGAKWQNVISTVLIALGMRGSSSRNTPRT